MKSSFTGQFLRLWVCVFASGCWLVCCWRGRYPAVLCWFMHFAICVAWFQLSSSLLDLFFCCPDLQEHTTDLRNISACGGRSGSRGWEIMILPCLCAFITCVTIFISPQVPLGPSLAPTVLNPSRSRAQGWGHPAVVGWG